MFFLSSDDGGDDERFNLSTEMSFSLSGTEDSCVDGQNWKSERWRSHSYLQRRDLAETGDLILQANQINSYVIGMIQYSKFDRPLEGRYCVYILCHPSLTIKETGLIQ